MLVSVQNRTAKGFVVGVLNFTARRFSDIGADNGLQRIIASRTPHGLSSKMALFLFCSQLRKRNRRGGFVVSPDEQVYSWLKSHTNCTFPWHLICTHTHTHTPFLSVHRIYLWTKEAIFSKTHCTKIQETVCNGTGFIYSLLQFYQAFCLAYIS